MLILSNGLNPAHRLDLENSGLSEETIKASGIHSVPPVEIDKILGKAKAQSVQSLMAIPYGNGTNFTRYKLFPPIKLSSTEKKPAKYFQPPGSPIHVYQPSGFDPNGPIIRITEGEKKALKGTQEGLNVCALGGIWNFAQLDNSDFPQLIEPLKNFSWPGKEAQIIPDGDFQKNLSVSHAVFRLGTLLRNEGAEVSIIRLPAEAKLDDYLCNHSVETFSELDLLTLEDRIFRAAMVKERGYEAAIEGAVLGIEDFLSLKIEPRPFILKPILNPGTLGMIFSSRGVGKTMFALSIAIAMTHSAPIGKWKTQNPVGVLYLDSEMAGDELQTRMKKLTAGLPSPLVP